MGALQTPLFHPAKCDVLCQMEIFIHFPTWSWNEVQRLRNRARVVFRE